ncbi:hypothetical protein LCGC14_2838930 [marine sediment metagenome]|uniref:Uncharacterized protein n=1 Tax=marine sediment metagenome TaxID=412755 RepID=A0A0F9AKA0_9ZZZZ
MSKAVIGLVLKDGKIAIQIKIQKINQAEMSLLITHLEILKQELISNFKKGIRKVEENGKYDGKYE